MSPRDIIEDYSHGSITARVNLSQLGRVKVAKRQLEREGSGEHRGAVEDQSDAQLERTT